MISTSTPSQRHQRKTLLVFLLGYIPFLVAGQVYQKHTTLSDRLSIELSEGVLSILPLTSQAIRVKWEKGAIHEPQEFVLIHHPAIPRFKVEETEATLKLMTSDVTVLFDKQKGAIQFADKQGSVFLKEKEASRKLLASTVLNEPCFIAEQQFESPADEHLFGLGQFQDGFFNLRHATRKLIQVNSQIAIPFLYSSKGYGILWHQYGLTWFNPADNEIALAKRDTSAGEKREEEVTTTAGTQRVSQQQSVYYGKFTVDEAGEYSLFLDLGNMESRHLVILDGTPVIDQTNLWLPPAVGKLLYLDAGEHAVQVVCKSSNTPKLTWKRTANETTFRSPNAKSLDYVVFHGEHADEVVANYRNITGNVPMLPLWAYGFWQCRERYTSGSHLVETVKEFRKRNLPLDVIVQDWQYWGKYGWGVPKFDEANYPNPEQFIQQLHDLNAHFSISVWENLDKKSEIAQEYVSKNLYIPNSPWVDMFNPEAQKTHWRVLNQNLFAFGVDSWWMDATEPENDALTGKQTFLGLGDFYRLTYPLFVSKAVYDGQRLTDPQKRVTILTRSAFAGQQRYGTINWSGDVGWNWDAFRRQIVAGLNFNLTGIPYWTTDIGGFFRPGRGQYTDETYREILTRWFQWGAFSPIFRMHGYQSETEVWKYGETVEANARKMLQLRYRLLPYIYSESWQVSSNGSTMMRPLVMDFPSDTTAVQQAYQYLFGKSLLVAPVTEAKVAEWNVYLPKQTVWFDFWTGKRFPGGQTIATTAPLDKIPVFVKQGAILPMGTFIQHSGQMTMDTLEIRIYSGANGRFDLYSDEGDNYQYEKGVYKVIPLVWDEQKQTLTIEKQQGSYPGALARHVFHLVWVDETKGYGIGTTPNPKTILYTGKRIKIKTK